MDIERETVVEAAIGIGSVLAFLVALWILGEVYYDGSFGREGALALVGTIIAFIVFLAGVGYYLAQQKPAE